MLCLLLSHRKLATYFFTGVGGFYAIFEVEYKRPDGTDKDHCFSELQRRYKLQKEKILGIDIDIPSAESKTTSSEANPLHQTTSSDQK